MAIDAPILKQNLPAKAFTLVNKSPTLRAIDLEHIFKTCFFESYQTVLCGGANEPLYEPKQTEQEPNRIYYRYDYFASALHEIAHWCIAGEARRKLVDFGYWYAEDGRNAQQQADFEKVEIKPQAIEWAFSIACAKPFRVSIDNLLAGANNEQVFTCNVEQQLKTYEKTGFPQRAGQFIQALEAFYSPHKANEYNKFTKVKNK